MVSPGLTTFLPTGTGSGYLPNVADVLLSPLLELDRLANRLQHEFQQCVTSI
jgi:hypothetical protein